MNTKSKILILVLGIILVIVLLVSCKSIEPTQELNVASTPTTTIEEPSTITPEPMEPVATQITHDSLNIGETALISTHDNLDPKYAASTNSFSLLRNAYEGLTKLDANLHAIPGAAESWEYNSDATQVTFKLFSDLRYSDGTPLNAKRFEYALKRVLIPSDEWSMWGDFLSSIKGAENVLYANYSSLTDWQLSTISDSVEINALDQEGKACETYEQTDCLWLRIDFSTPTPNFHQTLTMAFDYPVKEEVITSESRDWWKIASNHIGNGPFIIQALESDIIKMVPNPYHHGSTVGYSLNLKYFEETSDLINAYIKNEIDMMRYSSIFDGLIDSEVVDHELQKFSGGATTAIIFNLSVKPFDDLEIRKAFAYAFDRKAYIDQNLEGNGFAMLSYIPPGFPGYDDTEDRWGYNPEAAINALFASTYYNPQSGKVSLPPIYLTYYDQENNNNEKIWESIRDQFISVFGDQIEFTLDPVNDYQVFYNRLSGRDTENPISIFVSTMLVDFPDPYEWLSLWLISNPVRQSNYQIYYPEFLQLIETAKNEPDEVVRNQMYSQAQYMLVGDIPAIFGWVVYKNYLVKPWVKGLEPSAMDFLYPGEMDPTTITME